MRYVVTVRGIGEAAGGSPRPLLTGFVERLGPGWTHIEVPYPASYGFVNEARNPAAPGYETTKRIGREQTEMEISAIVTRDPRALIVLAGYSAGADIVDDLMVSGLANRWRQVKCAVVVANPSNPGVTGLADYGIAAPERGRQHVDSRVIPVNHPADVICCCPPRSPLRVIAKLTPRMQLADPSVWARDVLAKLGDPQVRREIDRLLGPPWWPQNWGRYQRAIQDAGGYLGRPSTHITPYTTRPRASTLSMLEHAADEVLRRLA